jgi:hypothetical protein
MEWPYWVNWCANAILGGWVARLRDVFTESAQSGPQTRFPRTPGVRRGAECDVSQVLCMLVGFLSTPAQDSTVVTSAPGATTSSKWVVLGDVTAPKPTFSLFTFRLDRFFNKASLELMNVGTFISRAFGGIFYPPRSRWRGVETGPFEITLRCEQYSYTLNVIISIISRNRTDSLCLQRRYFTNQKWAFCDRLFWGTIMIDRCEMRNRSWTPDRHSENSVVSEITSVGSQKSRNQYGIST